MKEMIVQVPDDAVHMLEELVERIGGDVKKVAGNPEGSSLYKEITQAVKEMKLIKEGKKNARNAEEFLNEL